MFKPEITNCPQCDSENIRMEYGDDDHGNSGYVWFCNECQEYFDEDDI